MKVQQLQQQIDHDNNQTYSFDRMNRKLKKGNKIALRIRTLPEETVKVEDVDPRGEQAKEKLAQISMDTFIDEQVDSEADWTVKQNVQVKTKPKLRINTESQRHFLSNPSKIGNKTTPMNACSDDQKRQELEQSITINRYDYGIKKKQVRRKSCFSLLFDCQKYFKDKKMLTRQIRRQKEPIIVQKTNLFNDLILKSTPFGTQKKQIRTLYDFSPHKPSLKDKKTKQRSSFLDTTIHFNQIDQVRLQNNVSINKQNKPETAHQSNFGEPAQLKQKVFIFNGTVLKTQRTKLFSRIRRSTKENTTHTERLSL